MQTINELRAWGQKYLENAGVESSRLDCDVLLMNAAKVDRTALLIHGQRLIHDDICERFTHFIEQRAAHKPVQYITKYVEFMSLDFYIDERVLIPRPDSEILVEAVIAREKYYETAKGMDVGTGSGCIAVSVAHYLPTTAVLAVDFSADALDVARRNAGINGVTGRVLFDDVDIFSHAFDITLSNKLDFIMSNPPYIPTADIQYLQPNVKDYEPISALDGGDDGLKFYRRLAEVAPNLLADYGRIYLEIGYNQGQDVVNILKDAGFVEIRVLRDLASRDRVVCAVKGE